MIPKTVNINIQTGWLVAIVATVLVVVIAVTAAIVNATNKP